MIGYWVRQRLLFTVIMAAAMALIAVWLFVFPNIENKANVYNEQSIYKNSGIDFIAPEPSFTQVDELPGKNGIDRLLPFFLTKVPVSVKGKNRTTTVLLSDRVENLDFTMYSTARLISKSDIEFDNPILVDWKFCHDTSAGIGDVVSFSIGDETLECIIFGIYETNTVYDGGALFVPISNEKKEIIIQKSETNGYSAMYVKASDYNGCKSYLTTDYRPLGRLRDADQFETEEQYQVHYDAIMNSGYANEITDFRAKEVSAGKAVSIFMILVCTLLVVAVVIGFNVAMFNRGCEKVYFTKHCIPKGRDVGSYYNTSFIVEILLFMVVYAVAFVIKLFLSEQYIPKAAVGIEIVIVPIGMIIAEIISLCMNHSMVRTIKIKVEEEKARQEREKQARGETNESGDKH